MSIRNHVFEIKFKIKYDLKKKSHPTLPENQENKIPFYFKKVEM